MAIITTTIWNDQVTNLYEKDYEMEVARKAVHGQYFARRKALGAQRGSSVYWPLIEPLAPQVTALSQTSDVTPITSPDSSVSISVTEYGGAAQLPAILEATAYTDVHKAASETIAKNYADSTELRARYALLQGTSIYRPSGTSRALLTTATAAHQLTYDNLVQMKARCHNQGLPAWDGETHVLLIPPALEASVLANTDWKALIEYNNGKNQAGDIFRGEIGMLAGFRVVMSPWAKVYWGGGLPDATSAVSTTLNGAVAAGATSIVVAAGTNIAVGNFLKIGTAETAPTFDTASAGTDGCEVVQVADTYAGGAATTVPIVGFGNALGNAGLKYSHSTGATVIEAESVGSALILGKRSAGYVYSDKTGPNGKIAIEKAATVIPERFTNFSWWQIAGWGILCDRFIMRGEFAAPFGMVGYMEAL